MEKTKNLIWSDISIGSIVKVVDRKKHSNFSIGDRILKTSPFIIDLDSNIIQEGIYLSDAYRDVDCYTCASRFLNDMEYEYEYE